MTDEGGSAVAAQLDYSFRSRAACRDADPALFYPNNDREGERARARRQETALAYCSVCPVTSQCLSSAIQNRDTVSVSGFTTPDERAPLLRMISG